MNRQKIYLKLFCSISFLAIVLFHFNIYSQASSSTITFENKSGEPALVKLVGPTNIEVKVPNFENITVNVNSGEYYILIRYGSVPENYKYSKGDSFTVTQTSTHYSAITITLHKVIGGDYNTKPIAADEFEKESINPEAEHVSILLKSSKPKIVFMSLRDKSPEICIIDSVGSEQIKLTDNQFWDGDPQFSPDGSHIAFTSDRLKQKDSQIYVMDIDGNNCKKLTNLYCSNNELTSFICYPDDNFCWSPDGTKIAYVSSEITGSASDLTMKAIYSIETINIYNMDVNVVFSKIINARSYILSRERLFIGDLSWHPKGNKILFTEWLFKQNEMVSCTIDILKSNGNHHKTLLYSNNESISSPKWSPDGNMIAYILNYNLYVADTSFSFKRMIADEEVLSFGWSPDCNRIVYSAVEKDDNVEIYSIKTDGLGRIRLTNNDVIEECPSYSPDGAKILFIRQEYGSEHLEQKFKHVWVMNSDGSNQLQVTEGITFDQDPSWQPIIFKFNR